VEAALGNPSSSLIFRYEPVAQVVRELNAVIALTDTCPFSNKRFGERYLKQFKVASTGAWIHRMVKKCRCPGKKHVELMKRSADGKVSGTSDLKASQAYPPKFGAAVVQAWLAGEPNTVGKVAKVAGVAKKPSAAKSAIPPGSPAGSSGLWTCPVQSPSLKRKLQRGADGPVAKHSKGTPSTKPPSGSASWMKPPNA
jgi:hypothetical protein